jgi:hypothetical protein
MYWNILSSTYGLSMVFYKSLHTRAGDKEVMIIIIIPSSLAVLLLA